MDTLPAILLHLGLLLAAAPLLQGVIGRTKAVFAGRNGPPLLQPYRDLAKLWRKGFVFSRATSRVFHAGPIAGLVVPMAACLLLPFGRLAAPVSFTGDMFLFLYLFGVARFFVVASALDTGSSFEGMGSAREVTFSCLAEPTMLFCLLVLARFSRGLSLNALLGAQVPDLWSTPAGFSLALACICLFVVLLAENSRIPFDDPATHLELTMIHEVMVLDHGGPELGMILYGASMKLMVLGAFVLGVTPLPATGSAALDALVFLAALLALAVLVGVVESCMARLRLTRVPQVLIGASLVSIFALVLVLR